MSRALRVFPRFEKARKKPTEGGEGDDAGSFLKLGDVRSLQDESGGNTYTLAPDSGSVTFDMSREVFHSQSHSLQVVSLVCILISREYKG